jgi:hypothetical protein
VRSALYMAVLNARNHNLVIKKFADRLAEKNNPAGRLYYLNEKNYPAGKFIACQWLAPLSHHCVLQACG